MQKRVRVVVRVTLVMVGEVVGERQVAGRLVEVSLWRVERDGMVDWWVG